MASSRSKDPQAALTAMKRRVEKLEIIVSSLAESLDAMARAARAMGISDVSPTSKEILSGKPLTPPAITQARRGPAPAGVLAAATRGEAAKVEWVRSGELVSAKTLASAWGLTPQALGPAAKRGELFAIVVGRQRYYPSEFLDLERDVVRRVSLALKPLTSAEKLIFWKRRHGTLGARTAGQVLRDHTRDQMQRILELARAWASEAHPPILDETPASKPWKRGRN